MGETREWEKKEEGVGCVCAHPTFMGHPGRCRHGHYHRLADTHEVRRVFLRDGSLRTSTLQGRDPVPSLPPLVGLGKGSRDTGSVIPDKSGNVGNGGSQHGIPEINEPN